MAINLWRFGIFSIFPKSYVVQQLVRQLVFTMFITNNHNSFHLWWKKNLVKHQKVSKYYDQDCSKTLCKKKKLDLSHGAPLHMKTRVCLILLVHDCIWKQFFASNFPQAHLNLICLTILTTLWPLTQF